MRTTTQNRHRRRRHRSVPPDVRHHGNERLLCVFNISRRFHRYAVTDSGWAPATHAPATPQDLCHDHEALLLPPHGVVFVGPSGCGKSTLRCMVAGLEDIASGELRIKGTRVNETPPSRRGGAMVFQSYALYPHMGVRPEHVQIIDTREGPNTVTGLVAFLERLGEASYVYVRLSGGELVTVRQSGHSARMVGSPVSLYFPPDHCHLFDGDDVALPRTVDPLTLDGQPLVAGVSISRAASH